MCSLQLHLIHQRWLPRNSKNVCFVVERVWMHGRVSVALPLWPCSLSRSLLHTLELLLFFFSLPSFRIFLVNFSISTEKCHGRTKAKQMQKYHSFVEWENMERVELEGSDDLAMAGGSPHSWDPISQRHRWHKWRQLCRLAVTISLNAIRCGIVKAHAASFGTHANSTTYLHWMDVCALNRRSNGKIYSYFTQQTSTLGWGRWRECHRRRYSDDSRTHIHRI